jgi:hypothetical protein
MCLKPDFVLGVGGAVGGGHMTSKFLKILMVS